ncbi:hypothetical protein WA158_007086 [Blastocystis sp. Blastoise]
MDPSGHMQHSVMHPGIGNQPGPVVIPDSTYMMPQISITVPAHLRGSMNHNNVMQLQRTNQLGIPSYAPQPMSGVGPEELMAGAMGNIYLTSEMPMHNEVQNEMHSIPVNVHSPDGDTLDSFSLQQYLNKSIKPGIKLRPPKRAISAYGCFSRKIYKTTREELVGAKQSDIFSHIAEMWRDMSDEMKEPYFKESNEDKDRHRQEESNYKRLRKEVEKNYTPRNDDINNVPVTLRGSKTLQRAMHNKDSEKLAALLLAANNNDINSTLLMLKESANIIIHAGEQMRIEKLPDYINSSSKRKYPPNKRYHCPHIGCNKMFAWKSNMTVHMRTHDMNRRRDFVCNFPNCNKAFYDNQHLKQHHCPQAGCNKKYATRGGLQLHVKAHHKVDKKFKCDINGCDRAFVRRTDLKVHILRVHSECKPHPCPYPNCNKSYVTIAELKRHYAAHNAHTNSTPVIPTLSSLTNSPTQPTPQGPSLPSLQSPLSPLAALGGSSVNHQNNNNNNNTITVVSNNPNRISLNI